LTRSGQRHDSAFLVEGVKGIPACAPWPGRDGDNRGVTEQADVLLFAALQRWWDTSRTALAARGVTATLQGPFDALGMDPVYILHMDSERSEADVLLFRGGIVLFEGFDKHALTTIRESSVEVSSGDDLVDALDRFTERA
jgi:hypothetical protein